MSKKNYIHGISPKTDSYMFIGTQGWAVIPIYKMEEFGETLDSLLKAFYEEGNNIGFIISKPLNEKSYDCWEAIPKKHPARWW